MPKGGLIVTMFGWVPATRQSRAKCNRHSPPSALLTSAHSSQTDAGDLSPGLPGEQAIGAVGDFITAARDSQPGSGVVDGESKVARIII
jgi:hypothetical protein